MKREPPRYQPNGFEKSDAALEITCTPTEKLLWLSVFGKGKLGPTIRAYLNREAARRAKLPAATRRRRKL